MSWSDTLGAVSTLTPGHAESQRFGVSMARLVIGRDWRSEFDSESTLFGHVRAQLNSSPAEIVVLRAPSELVRLAGEVQATGRQVVSAGTLLYWELATAGHAAAPRVPGVEVSRLSGVEGSELDDVIRDSFDGYVSHYSHNARLDEQRISEGYVEWATLSVAAAGGSGLVLRLDGRAIGMATVHVDEELSALEIELAGVIAGYQGRGLYRHLLDEIVLQAAESGLGRVVISTQSHNIRVQRAWARVGFVPAASVDTLHLLRPGLAS